MKICVIPTRNVYGDRIFVRGLAVEDFIAYRDGPRWSIAHRCGALLYDANTREAATTLLRITQVAYDDAWAVHRIERYVGDIPLIDSMSCFRDVIDEGVEATESLFTGP